MSNPETKPLDVINPLTKIPPLQSEDASFESCRAGVHTVNQESTSIGVDEVNETEEPPATLPPKNRRKIFILSLDGGGMRGLIPARILWRLEELIKERTGETEVNLCDYFDFIAGTSTGALLTVMLTTPDETGKPLMNAAQCCGFYSHHGPQIFRKHRWYHICQGRCLQIWRPKFSPWRLENLLQEYLSSEKKQLTLKDSLIPVLVTGFDIARAAPYFFTQTAAKKDDSHDFRLWEICRGVSAAPTFFPPYRFESVDKKNSVTLIDGGTIQNNPALIALTHVLGHKELYSEAKSIKDVMLLSLGAGQLDEKYSLEKSRKWGMAAWVTPLMYIMMDGSSDAVDYQIGTAYAGQFSSTNYLRIQLSGLPKSTKEFDCASESNVHDLIQCTDDLLKQYAMQRDVFGEKKTMNVTYDECLSKFADELVDERRERMEAEKKIQFENKLLSIEKNAEEKEKRKEMKGWKKNIHLATKKMASPLANQLERKSSKVFNRSISIVF